MSKQSEAKARQNYCDKPIPKIICANCKYLVQDFYHYSQMGRIEGKNPNANMKTYSENLKCGIGGFAVKKTAVCDNIILNIGIYE